MPWSSWLNIASSNSDASMATSDVIMNLKQVCCSIVDSHNEELLALSDCIWKEPELCFKEFKAHQLLTDYLEKKGFAVERSYTGLETAFRATFGSGRPNICVICEYDALPDIGHACGHNLIAEAGVAAGLGLKAALEASQGGIKGRVTVLGTPAEEGGGGKVILIENGAFSDVDAAMMVHPYPQNVLVPEYLATVRRVVTYTGRAAHAAAFPWEGVNALDAAVMAYNSISVLRQQMKPACKVHGVIKEGGVKPNIIPERAVMEYQLRAPSERELSELEAKITACFEAAATATGCQVKIEHAGKPYIDLITNGTMAKLFAENMAGQGIEWEESPVMGSTDMGNVSHAVPSIHPCFAIGGGEAVNHTRDFTALANRADAHTKAVSFAKGMVCTGIDLLVNHGLVEKLKA